MAEGARFFDIVWGHTMKVLVNEVVGPLALRLGTATSGFLIGQEVTTQHANAVGVGATALVLVVLELAVRKFFKG